MSFNNSDDKKIALNRSFSFSGSPVSQKICIEQSFQNKRGETLIRQYSCEQIGDRFKKPRLQYKESVFLHTPSQSKNSPSMLFNSFESSVSDKMIKFHPNLNRFPLPSQTDNSFGFYKSCPEQKDFEKSLKYNKELESQDYTPMEVDTSTELSMSDVHSVSKNGNENNLNEQHNSKVSKLIVTPNKVRKESINVATSPKPVSRIIKYLKSLTMILIPVVCAFLMMYSNLIAQSDVNIGSDHFNTQNITEALQDLVYGQKEVIYKLKESLSYVENSHLIVFTGGIGVGKTYSANIIANNFQWKSNIKRITSPHYKNPYHETNIFKSLSDSGYNLVIIDNLEIDDKHSVVPFVKRLFESDKKTIIILIFTIPEVSLDTSEGFNLIASSKDISELLSKFEIKHSLIIFNKLNADVVRECIRYAMFRKGLIIDQYKIDQVLADINYNYSGCKGVHTKVALIR